MAKSVAQKRIDKAKEILNNRLIDIQDQRSYLAKDLYEEFITMNSFEKGMDSLEEKENLILDIRNILEGDS